MSRAPALACGGIPATRNAGAWLGRASSLQENRGMEEDEQGLGAWGEGNGRELADSREDRVYFLLMFYVNI